MANWCWNCLQLEGKTENIEKVHLLFEQMEKHNTEKQEGAKPFDKEPKRYFFEIYRNGDYWYYSTKWAPNPEDCVEIANTFDVDFTLNYEELGCQIYGEYRYKDKKLTDICLDDSDFEQVIYDEDNDCYTFRNKEYESDSECYDILLDEKIKNEKI